jgi:hypothetical protein
MKMYKVELYDYSIKVVEVERKTDKSVWINDQYGLSRFAKMTEFESYWDSWEEAHLHIFKTLKERKELIEAQLVNINTEIQKVLKMKRTEYAEDKRQNG